MSLPVPVRSPLVQLYTSFQPHPLPVRCLLHKAVDSRINVLPGSVLKPELWPRRVGDAHLLLDASPDELEAELDSFFLVPRVLPDPVDWSHVVSLVLDAIQHDLQSLR